MMKFMKSKVALCTAALVLGASGLSAQTASPFTLVDISDSGLTPTAVAGLLAAALAFFGLWYAFGRIMRAVRGAG